MLNHIIGFSIRNKLIVTLGVLLLIATGIYQLSKLPIDALPDITSNQVQVITISPALAAPEVERLITFTIEQSCANIPGMTEMRSISRFGLSVVTLVFTDKTDIYWARQQVSERMVGIREQIPPGAGSPEMAPLTTGLGEVYQYFLHPQPGYEERYSLGELRSMQDWIVRRQLLGTPGVADVSSFGGYLKQYEVSVEPARLQAMGVTLHEVFTALETNNQNSGGAYIEKGPTAQFIRTEGLAGSIEDIERMPIKQTTMGLPVLVRDVAKVTEGKAMRYGALVHEDKGEVAGAVVLMLKGANASAVVKAVKQKIADIQHSLPEGVVIEPFYDRTKVVDRALNTVTINLAEGALIVIFILVLFLGNLRAGLIVASVIPLSMLFAVCLMNVFGVSGNLMSLGALDFGLIVDGAVIIVEAVLHRLHAPGSGYANRRLSQSEMDVEVKGAAGKMMNAAVFGQIIILIVYLPILTLAGIEGKMFTPMAQTVAFALIGAFLLSLTYVPMVTALFISKSWNGKLTLADRMMIKLRNFYQPLLKSALRRPAIILLSAGLMFASSLWVLSRLGGEFIPELEEGDFAVDTRLLAGTSLTHTIEVAQQTAGLLKKQFPEVERIVTRVGASEIPTDPMPMEMSDVIILLKPKNEWTSAKSYDELADKMSEVLEDIPGLTAGFQFPIQMRFNELISGARQDVVCKLFGEDLDTLSAYAGKLAAMMQGVEGVSDLYLETVTGLAQIQVVFDRSALARYGINITDANRIIQAAFAGSSAGLVYENERRYDLVVRLSEQYRDDVDHIRQLLIPAPGGQQIPLNLLADVDIEEGPNQIQREDAKRRIIVSFNVRNRDVESVVKDVQGKVAAQIKLPAGYYMHYGGAFENLQEAKNRLGIAVPVALLLIFLLLYFAFGNLGPGLIIFSAIPLSAIGGIFALWLRDMPFSISAGIGFIALFGVSVLNGIVLLTEVRRLYHTGDLPLAEAIIEGCSSRLRPVLMTAAVASFGFLPMALSQRAGAEVQRPLATVVIAGLITASLLTLFVLPVLYQWMEKRKRTPRTWATTAVLLLLLPASLMAQQRQVPLNEALAFVRQYHPEVAVGKLKEQYQQTMMGTAKVIPKTQLELEAGQNEGPYFDARFGAIQSFQPMGLHRRQTGLLQSYYDMVKQQTVLAQKDAERLVKVLYSQYFAANERDLVLAKIDSTVAKTLLLSRKRLETGESDRLELINVEQLEAGIRQQRVMLQFEQQALRRQLGLLLLSNEEVTPVGGVDPRSTLPTLVDTALLANHPLVQIRLQEAKSAEMATQVERALNNVEWLVGVNTLSVTGWQTAKDGVTDTYYDIGNRFVSGMVGVSVPLFARAQKARIKAAQQQKKVAAGSVDWQKQKLTMQYLDALTQWQSLQQQENYYRQEALPRANQLAETAQRRFAAGSISYIEWSMLMQQAIQTQLAYVDVQYQTILKSIDLQYYYSE